MKTTPPAIEFPCLFPIKALGKTQPELDSIVVSIIRRHVADISEGAIKTCQSKGGKYTSVTVTIQAINQEQLDAIYRDLTACPQIIMSL